MTDASKVATLSDDELGLMSIDELGDLLGRATRIHGAKSGSPIKSQADFEAVERNVHALRNIQGGAMFDAFKAQVLLALILRTQNKQLVLTVDEVDRTGGWSARMATDPVARTFTFIASKHQ